MSRLTVSILVQSNTLWHSRFYDATPETMATSTCFAPTFGVWKR